MHKSAASSHKGSKNGNILRTCFMGRLTDLEVLAVDPAEDFDLNWSPCLMSAPFGEMENDRSRYIMASVSAACSAEGGGC